MSRETGRSGRTPPFASMKSEKCRLCGILQHCGERGHGGLRRKEVSSE